MQNESACSGRWEGGSRSSEEAQKVKQRRRFYAPYRSDPSESRCPLWRLIQQQQQLLIQYQYELRRCSYNLLSVHSRLCLLSLFLPLPLCALVYFILYSVLLCFCTAKSRVESSQVETFDANLCPANGHGMLTRLELGDLRSKTSRAEPRLENRELQLGSRLGRQTKTEGTEL